MLTPGAFRLVLATLVVIHHSFPLRLGAWAVGMFFVLSGYWVARIWRQKYSRQASSYFNFLLSRWWRLAPLFFTIHGVALLLSLLETTGSTSVISKPIWWLLQPMIVGSAQHGTLLPPAWSLDTEMQFYLVAPLMIPGLGAFRKQEQLIFLFLLVLWSVVRLSGPSGLSTPQLDLFLWLFLVGVMSDRFEWHPKGWLTAASCGLIVLLVIGVLLLPTTRPLLWQRGTDAAGGTETPGNLIFILLMVVVAIPFTISTVHLPSGKIDRWLGDLSYPLYLFHWIPRDWYYANTDWSRPAWWNGGLLIANLAMAFTGAILLLHLVDRPAQRLRNRWLQSKQSPAEPQPPNEPLAA